jgi:hypothetical protein
MPSKSTPSSQQTHHRLWHNPFNSFVVDGRKGSIWLPEGRDGRGCKRVAGELSKLVAFLESASGLRVGAKVSSVGKVQLSSDGYPFKVSFEKGGVVSSYAEVVRGTVGSSGKFSATTEPMAEMHEMDLLPMSLFRDEEDLRVAVNCFDMEKKTPGLKEKFSTNRNHGGGKRRKLKLENSRLWKNLLGHLGSELDQVASTMAQIIGLGLKPNRSLGVKCARVGFKPILKKVRGSVLAGHVLSLVVAEFDPFVKAHSASSLHVSADPVEEKNSTEDPSRISELSTVLTLGEKVRDAVYWWRKEVSKLQEKKDQPIVYDQNWEKDCWRIEAELSEKIFKVYPLVIKEQRQREIWGEMIENKKHESKRELRNLQSFVNYEDIKASSRCRRDKANRS